MTPEEREFFAIKCATNLLDFSCYFFNHLTKLYIPVNSHHIAICDKLMAVYRGEINRLIINVPPRYYKTQIAVINFIAWALATRPQSKFIHTSYSLDLVTLNSRSILDIIHSDDYQDFYDVRLKGPKPATQRWDTEAGGGLYAVQMGGGIVGFGAGLDAPGFNGAIIIDDPHKTQDVESKSSLIETADWYGTTLKSRTNSRHTPIIVIMQRLHENDLTGFLLNGGSGEHWEHLCLPAYDENEVPLWPHKHTIEELKAMEANNPYVFAAQYMQKPVPKEGGLFKVDNFRYMDAVPTSRITKTVRYWDKAGSENRGDYTVGVKISQLDDGSYLIWDVKRGRWASHDRERIIKDTAATDKSMGRVEIWLEIEGGSGGKESAENTIRNLAGFIVKAEHPTGSKETRAEPLSSQVNVGNVYLLRAEWNKEFIDEFGLFPRSKHDDQVDAASGGFNKLASVKKPKLSFYRRW